MEETWGELPCPGVWEGIFHPGLLVSLALSFSFSLLLAALAVPTVEPPDWLFVGSEQSRSAHWSAPALPWQPFLIGYQFPGTGNHHWLTESLLQPCKATTTNPPALEASLLISTQEALEKR